MVYRRRRGGYRRRRAPIGRRTRRIRRLAGQSPVTGIERLAGMAGAVGRVARTVSMISGLVNSELKHKDSALTGTLLNTGLYQVPLSNIAQGDDYNFRNGRSILMKSLSMRMTISRGATAGATQLDHVGWAIILDTRPDEGTSAWATVYDSLNPWSHVDTQTHSGRFVILARGQVALDGFRQQVNVKRFINLKGIHSKFDGTGATDYDKNTLFLVGISDAATSTEPVTAGEIRLTYYDN